MPFPPIDELTLRARNCKFFTKLDVNSAFRPIPLRDMKEILDCLRDPSWALAVELLAVRFKVLAGDFSKDSLEHIAKK